MSDNTTENADAILLTWPDFVRKRPGMYFRAVHELVWCVINRAIDKTLANFGDHIDVVLHDSNVISIRDNGAGMGVELEQDTGRPILDLILTSVHVNEFQSSPQARRVSMFDVSLACVNAVSEEFLVEVRHNGFLWQTQYKEGKLQSKLEQVRPLLSQETSGTTITLKPDFSVFGPCDFDYKFIADRCRELGYLVPGITINLNNKQSSAKDRSNVFSHSDGLIQYVSCLNKGYPVLHNTIVSRESVALKRNHEPLGYTADIEIAFQYADVHQPILLGFVNAFNVEHGGTHIRGLIEALTRTITDYASQIGISGGHYRFIEDDIVCGLAVVLSIWHPTPQFEGSAQYKLMNPELEDATYHVTRRAFEAFSAAYPDQMRRIIEKCLENKALRFRRRYSL